MTNFQLLTLISAIMALITAQTTILVLYINAKVDPLKQQVDFLVKYMVEHSEKISVLDERTKPKPSGGMNG